jgi:hypothetical protein
MGLQIALGTGLLIANILVMALAALALEVVFKRTHRWLLRPPQRPRLLLMLVGVSLWVLAVISLGVWTWALALYGLGAHPTLEEAVYFATVAFTTLGLGDVVPSLDWRILSAMAAVNGFLSFGLLAALLVEALRLVRLAQLDQRQKG